MKEIGRIGALILILIAASVAWLGLGGIMTARTSDQESSLYGAVADLWGEPLQQRAPTLTLHWQEQVTRSENVYSGGELVRDARGQPVVRSWQVWEPRSREVQLASSDVDIDLHLDQRRKGLMWFSLYDVDFAGAWTYVHDDPQDGTLRIQFHFPVTQGVYDDFRFTVNGQSRADELRPSSGYAQADLHLAQGDEVAFEVGYRSRGLGQYAYLPTSAVGQRRDFELDMSTGFADIDFPPFTMSPSTKERTEDGWALHWTFTRLVTGHGMGMVMPERVQPGPLAAKMSFSAPISLFLFTLWIYVLGLLRRIDIHPMNHLFLAGAFFSFHLLFSYSADHLPVEWAFAVSAATSVFLVVTYLRLAVGPRFALLEAGLAQLVYLVGFSLAHFWDGYTGLTVTVMGILTLFALMQLTGRLDWGAVFSGARTAPREPAPTG